MKTLIHTCAFVVLFTTLNATPLTNPFDTHTVSSLLEHRNCSHSNYVGLDENKKTQSEHIKHSNGTGDPVLHGTGLGTAPVQTGILSSTGSGLALSLPGDNDYVSIPNSSELQFASQGFSIEFWVRLDSMPDFGDVILGKWDNTGNEGNNEWAFGVSHLGSPYFVLESGYSQTNLGDFSFTMGVGKWYHLAVTKSPGIITFRVNGLEMATQYSNPSINTTTLPITIGNSNSGLNDSDITIDDIRIWSQEIAEINLRQFMCKKLNGDNHPQFDRLISHYRFDEGSGASVPDSWGSNSGTPVNTPQWITSGAPLGNESVAIYNPPVFSQLTSLTHPSGDFARLQFTDGPPNGVHIYQVNEVPNTSTAPDNYTGFDDHYYGVFVVDVNNTFWEYQLTYGYAGSPFENTNDARVAFRENNADDTWENVNGSPDDYLNTFTASFRTVNGEYILEGENGGTDDCTVVPSNAITLSASPDLCEGDALTLSADSGYNYLWSNGETTQSINVQIADDYTVTVSDDMGCSSISDPVTVTIKNVLNDFLISSQISYLLQPTDVASVDFTAAVNGTITSYEWDFGDGNTSTDVTPTHTYADAGFYTVTLTVTDDENCQQTLTKTNYANVWLVFPSTNVSPTGVTQNITGASFNGAYSGCIAIQSGNGTGGGGYVCITSDGTNWTPAGTIATGSDLTSIYLSSGGTGYITGTNGLICVYNGSTWTQFNTGTTAPFYNCWFGSNNYGWSVGGNGTICVYNGTGWTPTSTGVTNTFYGVWGYGTNTWAVGSGGIICVYGGTSWGIQSSGATAQLNGVYFVNDLVGYVCGNGGTILGTTNGGNTWNTLQAEGSLAWNLNAVWAIDADNIIAVGDNGVVCISTDGGANWDLLSIGTTVDLLDVTVENCTGYCTGANGTVFQFPFPGCTPSLPIELIDFTAIENNKKVYLKWETATETNNDYFVVERSNDGGWFEALGRMDGAGTTSIAQNYAFTDHSPKYGLNYYRLKQVDTDGKFAHSSVIPILIETQPREIILFPNPVSEKATVIYHSPKKTTLKFLISDEAGRWIATPTFNVEQGQNTLELDMRDLPPAVYFLSLKNGDAIRFLKE